MNEYTHVTGGHEPAQQWGGGRSLYNIQYTYTRMAGHTYTKHNQWWKLHVSNTSDETCVGPTYIQYTHTMFACVYRIIINKEK